MFFSVITKNLNWGVLTKNLVTFRRRDGFNLEFHWEIWFKEEGVHKKPNI